MEQSGIKCQFYLKILIFLCITEHLSAIRHRSKAMLKNSSLITYCAWCASADIVKFNKKSRCICSQFDKIQSNFQLCLKAYNKKECQRKMGKCCMNENEQCPICNHDNTHFTRSDDCDCDSNYEKVTILKPVTDTDEMEAYCCKETQIDESSEGLVPMLKMIRPIDRRKFLKYLEDDNKSA
jgi:hypothetical protein